MTIDIAAQNTIKLFLNALEIFQSTKFWQLHK